MRYVRCVVRIMKSNALRFNFGWRLCVDALRFPAKTCETVRKRFACVSALRCDNKRFGSSATHPTSIWIFGTETKKDVWVLTLPQPLVKMPYAATTPLSCHATSGQRNAVHRYGLARRRRYRDSQSHFE